MKFYTYSQNNSGGGFDHDEKSGIGHYVIVEAASAADANSKAEDIGIYFDGVSKDQDCECCGDRWSSADEYEGKVVPMLYNDVMKPVSDENPETMISWNIPSYIHYANGAVAKVAKPGKDA